LAIRKRSAAIDVAVRPVLAMRDRAEYSRVRHPTRVEGAFVMAKSGNGVLDVHVEDIAQNAGESAASMKI
jgi:hypothetical protein